MEKQQRLKDAQDQINERRDRKTRLDNKRQEIEKAGVAAKAKKAFRQHLNSLANFTKLDGYKQTEVEQMLLIKPGQYILDTKKRVVIQVYGLTQGVGEQSKKYEILYKVKELGATDKEKDGEKPKNKTWSPPKHWSTIQMKKWSPAWKFVTKNMAVELIGDHNATRQWKLGAPEQEKGDIEGCNAYIGRPTVYGMTNKQLCDWVKKEKARASNGNDKKIWRNTLTVLEKKPTIDGNQLIKWSKTGVKALYDAGFKGKGSNGWSDSKREILKTAVLEVNGLHHALFNGNGINHNVRKRSTTGSTIIGSEQAPIAKAKKNWKCECGAKKQSVGKPKGCGNGKCPGKWSSANRRRLASRRRSLENRPIHRLLREIHRAQA